MTGTVRDAHFARHRLRGYIPDDSGGDRPDPTAEKGNDCALAQKQGTIEKPKRRIRLRTVVKAAGEREAADRQGICPAAEEQPRHHRRRQPSGDKAIVGGDYIPS